MTDKILTSDELAQKFLDNVNHIGISDTFRNRITLDNVKTAINKGWGFNMDEGNKCVCCDYSEMNSIGKWGTDSDKNEMAYFWQQVYNSTVPLLATTNPTANTVHTQIVVVDDKQLLPESKVDVKGTCAQLSNVMRDNVTVTHTGITSGTTVSMRFFPKVNGENAVSAPSLIVQTLSGDTTTNFISSQISYIDADADDTTVDWDVHVHLSYPSGTKLPQTGATRMAIDGLTFASFSVSGSTGITSTTFTKTIPNKSINQFAGITKLGFDTPMQYEEPIPDIEIDVSNCYVETSTDSHLKINTATYVSNMASTCYFVNFPGDGPFETAAITMPCAIVSSGQQLKIKILQNEASKFTASTSYWMWVGMRASLSTGQVYVRYCFEVNVQRLSDRCNISLVSTECYIDLSSTNTSILDYTTYSNANYTVKNIESASNKYTSLSTTGTNTLGYRLGGFVMNKISVYKNSGDSSGIVRYKVGSGYLNLGSIPNNDQGFVNLIHGDYFSRINEVHRAMYSDTLSYDFY